MSTLTPEEAAARLQAFDAAVTLAPTMERIVRTVEGGVKRRTPVLTGRLRRSVHGQVLSTTEGVVGTNVIYARPVHRRTPFLEQGVADVAAEIDRILGDAGVWGEVTG